MPLSTKISQPATDPATSPVNVQVEVRYTQHSGGGGESTTAEVVLNWPAEGLAYVNGSASPEATVDKPAGTITWSDVALTSGDTTVLDLQLSCIQAGSGPHTLTAQASGNGELSAANPCTFACPR